MYSVYLVCKSRVAVLLFLLLLLMFVFVAVQDMPRVISRPHDNNFFMCNRACFTQRILSTTTLSENHLSISEMVIFDIYMQVYHLFYQIFYTQFR